MDVYCEDTLKKVYNLSLKQPQLDTAFNGMSIIVWLPLQSLLLFTFVRSDFIIGLLFEATVFAMPIIHHDTAHIFMCGCNRAMTYNA